MLEISQRIVNNYFKNFQKRFPKKMARKYFEFCQESIRENLEFFSETVLEIFLQTVNRFLGNLF